MESTPLPILPSHFTISRQKCHDKTFPDVSYMYPVEPLKNKGHVGDNINSAISSFTCERLSSVEVLVNVLKLKESNFWDLKQMSFIERFIKI